MSIAIKQSRKVYKKAVKSFINEQVTEDVIEGVYFGYKNEVKKSVATIEAILSAVEIKALGYTDLIQYIQHPKPVTLNKTQKNLLTAAELAQRENDFVVYTLCQKVFYLDLRRYELGKAVNGLNFHKLVKESFTAFADMFSKSKKDEVILNSFIPRVQRLYDCGLEAALAHLEAWHAMGILSRRQVEGEEGGKDHMLKFNLDVDHLTAVYLSTSDRTVMFTTPETSENRVLVNRRKADYKQVISKNVSIGIDHITSTEMVMLLTREQVVEAVSRKIYGHAEGTFTEKWQKTELKYALAEYDEIMEQGGKFRVDTTTDSIFRLYNKSNNFGVQQGEFAREHLEFAEQFVPNESALTWFKLFIASKNGYSKKTKKEALDGYEQHAEEWRAEGKCSREFYILDNPTEPTGYMMELDAQSQSFSYYGLAGADLPLIGDCGYSTERSDLRTKGAEFMNEVMGVTVWNKDNLKSAAMNKAYTAGMKTILWGAQKKDAEYLELVQTKRQIPLMATGMKLNIEPEVIGKVFNAAMKEVAPAAISIMEAMQSKLSKNKEDSMTWTMPDGAECEVIFNSTETKHLNWASSDGAMHTIKHQVAIIDPGKAYNSVPPRMIQGLDAYSIRYVATKMKEIGAPFVGVHDGYITHPNFADQMVEFYKEVSIEIVATNMLSHLFQEATGHYINFQSKVTAKQIEKVIEAIKEGEYPLYF